MPRATEPDFEAEETHSDPTEGEITRRYYSCPECEFDAVVEWMDCPECGWFDEEAWQRATEVSA